jgi:hypothetical protein
MAGTGQRQQATAQHEPAPTIATACSGLLLERGKTGPVTSPTDQITAESLSTATAEPQ